MTQAYAMPPSEQAVIGKIFRRLIPFLALMYVVAYLDRMNIAFASLSMNHELGLSAAMFGFANTAFFATYALAEIPSNLLCARLGAHRWLPRIVLVWGIASMATMFVTGPLSLYGLRALVGLAEAGFVPGVLYYLSHWMPREQRAKANALFLLALPIALAVGGPLSGLILQMPDPLGLASWRWLFLLEGAPAVILGMIAFFLLPAGPSSASWLTGEERAAIAGRLARDQAAEAAALASRPASIWRQLASRPMICLAFGYFTIAATVNTYSLWSPQMIHDFLGQAASPLTVTLWAGVPPLAAAAVSLAAGIRSDRTGERKRYLVVLMMAACMGWVLVAHAPGAGLKIMGLVLAAIGAFATPAIFWALTMPLIAAEFRAVAIAAISTVGLLASMISPTIVGLLRDLTQSFSAGLWYVAVMLFLGVGLILAAGRSPRRDVMA